MHSYVFMIASLVALVFLTGKLLFPEAAWSPFDGALSWSIANVDWLFVLVTNLIVLFCPFAAFL